MWLCDGERGSGPEGADELRLVGLEVFEWDLSLNAGICASRFWFEPRGLDVSQRTRIQALRLGFEPLDWDLSLETGIWAS